jgi:hypothetical protein
MEIQSLRSTIAAYQRGDLSLEEAALRIVEEQLEPGWYFYSNTKPGTPAKIAQAMQALEQRVNELVLARDSLGRPPERGTA